MQTEYHLIHVYTEKELKNEIETKLKNGWILYGPTQVVQADDKHFAFFQAMLKHATPQLTWAVM